jgi:aerobic carbon-monoxide dehydrogenase small subunit
MRPVRLRVNGREHTVHVEDRKLLLDTLREDLHLTGAHPGCEHGVCGACTVHIDGTPARSCLTFTAQAHDHDITTVEGLSPNGQLTPLQHAFIDHLGAQCGYCTPGMLLTAQHLLDHNPTPTEAEVRHAISGNLCRCTGYNGIITSILAAAASTNPVSHAEER